MSVIAVNPRFHPGRLMITRNAKDVLPHMEVDAAIKRHLQGDWGDVCQSDGELNEEALLNGDRCQRRCGFVVFRRTENVEKWRVKVYSP